MESTRKPPTGVLERGLRLLECFTQDHPRRHLKDLSEESGLDKATALRALRTLVEHGYLQKNSDGSYSPGPANLRLSALFRATSNIITRLEAPVQQISQRTGLTTSFFVRSNDERLCLVRDQARRDFRFYVEVGASVAMREGGAAARVLEAFTGPDSELNARIRADGYYISHGERNKHFASIGISLFESDATFLGAITITGMAIDLTDEQLMSFVDIVEEEVARSGFLIRKSQPG
ncbi:IclR family transcriptional regulator [Amorphus sp. 3PC139-8]|uniref:IclR family transcriptional regulator n=1 Tax=Amorphus sp. 3PC139-8 TaxID=2735676 RepID=UPI00345DA38B